MTTKTTSAAGYEIGYARPPRHAQFKTGRSGNPKGRPRGVNNLSTDVKRALSTRHDDQVDSVSQFLNWAAQRVVRDDSIALPASAMTLPGIMAIAKRIVSPIDRRIIAPLSLGQGHAEAVRRITHAALVARSARHLHVGGLVPP